MIQMTLKIKKDGAWKEASSLKVKINGEWKDVSTLYSKKDGAWVTVYSSGALITFSSYPYPIPVAKGWKYSTDGVNWTTVEADGEINKPISFTTGDWAFNNVSFASNTAFGGISVSGITGSTPACSKIFFYADDETYLSSYPDGLTLSPVNGTIGTSSSVIFGGNTPFLSASNRSITLLDANGNSIARWSEVPDPTFTGFIKANSITLNEYYTEYIFEQIEVRQDGEPLSTGGSGPTSFVNANKGYVCGGSYAGYNKTVDVYDTYGVKTYGTELSVGRYLPTSFVNNSKGYVCGGLGMSDKTYNTVDVYNSSGNRTTGQTLYDPRYYPTSFVNGGKGYVCGGMDSNNSVYSTVDVYDSSGNRSRGTSLYNARWSPTSFVINGNGYVCGGRNLSTRLSNVDVYNSSGNRTSGTPLGVARDDSTSFTIGENGYVCGGSTGSYSSAVDIYDSSGNRTTGISLSVARFYTTSFVNNEKGYICGGAISSGKTASVEIYDSSGNRTDGIDLSKERNSLTSFANGGRGYVCGGQNSKIVDIYYDQSKVLYTTKLPITEGSTYTLNGESGTADVSKVMEFDSKVSGTIKYKAGDLFPGIKITVVDESGNVVEGATVSIEKMSNNWDISNINVTITAVSS